MSWAQDMSTTTWRLCVKKPKPGATTGFDAMTEYLLVCPECLENP